MKRRGGEEENEDLSWFCERLEKNERNKMRKSASITSSEAVAS
jgi:hypothetical protein